MSENINIFSTIADIKSVISSLFVKISTLAGGGQSKPTCPNFQHYLRFRFINFGLKPFSPKEFFLLA